MFWHWCRRSNLKEPVTRPARTGEEVATGRTLEQLTIMLKIITLFKNSVRLLLQRFSSIYCASVTPNPIANHAIVKVFESTMSHYVLFQCDAQCNVSVYAAGIVNTLTSQFIKYTQTKLVQCSSPALINLYRWIVIYTLYCLCLTELLIYVTGHFGGCNLLNQRRYTNEMTHLSHFLCPCHVGLASAPPL